MATGWRAGAARVDMTPPLGVGLTGYALRPGPASTVHDPITARALVLSNGERNAALVSVDLLALSAAHVATVRAAAESCGIPAEHLLLNATHTHAGPATVTLRAMGPVDPDYAALVPRWIATALVRAQERLAPAMLSFGTAPTAIGINRREARKGQIVLGRNPTGPYDPTLYALRVARPDGTPIAVWFSHATHPVVMGSENTGLSAEWPGAACATIEGALGGGCLALFAQGCAGDINPQRRGGLDVVRSVGRECAGAALQAIETAQPVEGDAIAGAREIVPLPYLVPTRADAEARLAEMERQQAAFRAAIAAGERPPHHQWYADEMVAWARDYLAAAEREAAPCPLEVQALRLGDVMIVATAGETFSEIGMALQRRSPLRRTIALGYTNGCVGYLPTAKAYPEGGYEIQGALRFYGTLMVAPESEALILAAGERLMARAAE